MTTPWRLRPDQLKAYQAINGRLWAILNMPTGWGKSFTLCCLGANDLFKNGRKLIIAVPQRTIAKGFVKEMQIKLPGGQMVNWGIPRNLCDTTAAKVAQLVDFIKYPLAKRPHDRVVLCTHLSLAYAFQKLDDEEADTSFLDTTIFIDEAHHIQASGEACNLLGRAIDTILDQNCPTTRVLLATAYFFRGDRLPIVHDNHLSRFFRYHIPLDQYWKSLNHLKEYRYDFVAYKGTMYKEFDTVLSASRAPTIVYCPPEGHSVLVGKPKAQFVKRIAATCRKHYGADLWQPGCKSSRPQQYVVDLVSTEHRSEKIKFIADNGPAVAAILAVGMFREGADWVEAARVIDLVPTGSDQDRNQRFGRLIRDCPGKRRIEYLSFFPYVLEEEEDKRRRELSKLFAHFHASLVLENAMRPIKVPMTRKSEADDDEGRQHGERLDLLGKLDAATQESVLKTSIEELLKLQVQKSQEGLSVRADEAKDTIVRVLREHGINEHLDATAKQVVLVMRRKSNVSINAEELVKGGFDKVWKADIFDGLIAYSAGFGGPTTLGEIRKVIGNVFEQMWVENYERIRELPQAPNSCSSAYWWCAHNRVLYRQGELGEEKVNRLEAVSWWKWSEAFVDRWQQMYDRIKSFARCPKASTKDYGWVRQQRRQHQDGRLERYKIKLLESIPWWTWETQRDNWDAVYEEIKSMAGPPARETPEYNWVRTQRRAYKAGSLPPERAALLEQIPGWEWEQRRGSRDEGLQYLSDLLDDFGGAGTTKAELRAMWSEFLKIGSDQIHKYLRGLPDSYQRTWNRLPDDSGRRREYED